MDNLLPFTDSLPLLAKGVLLLLILLYFLFIFLAFVQIKALNRIVTISAHGESALAQILALIYLLLVASLFLVALVIL